MILIRDSKDCGIIVSRLSVEINGTRILSDLSFSVSSGEVLTVIGPNGAGKTTLLRVLANIIRPSSGLVRLCGHELDNDQVLSRILSYVPASPTADPWSKVIDLLLVARYNISSRYRVGSEDFRAALEVSELLGISNLLNRYFGSLSSGEAKLVMIAAALVRNPKILVMDEPLTYLDLRNQALIINLIRELAHRGLTIVTSSHELHLVPMYSTKVLLLNRGSMIAYGNPQEILTKDLIEKVYDTKLLNINIKGYNILIPSP